MLYHIGDKWRNLLCSVLYFTLASSGQKIKIDTQDIAQVWWNAEGCREKVTIYLFDRTKSFCVNEKIIKECKWRVSK